MHNGCCSWGRAVHAVRMDKLLQAALFAMDTRAPLTWRDVCWAWCPLAPLASGHCILAVVKLINSKISGLAKKIYFIHPRKIEHICHFWLSTKNRAHLKKRKFSITYLLLFFLFSLTNNMNPTFHYYFSLMFFSSLLLYQFHIKTRVIHNMSYFSWTDGVSHFPKNILVFPVLIIYFFIFLP